VAAAKTLLRPIISVVLIGATLLGLINVYGDNRDVVQQAERVACGSEQCSTNMTRMERNPISQNFTFQTHPKGQRAAAVDVTCQRTAWLFGDYVCRIETAP
jgi:Tfp pilus assembly protein PilV